MNKRLIICGDGTWNEPSQAVLEKASPTNVVKIASAASFFDTLGVSQIICYHDGVGAHGNMIDKLTGGALGVGISQNIRDLYLFLVLNYDPGDELFLFGFSRGAYTVRSLAGLIRNCGIIKKKYVEKFREAYEIYRDRTDETHPNATRSINFREQYSWPDFHIKFIGVWDTVGALGIPFLFQFRRKIWEFHDVELSSYVDYAYQALAIDEQRKSFVPCIWIKQPSSPQSQVLEQDWFPGVHCNIGGGYYETGLSDCSLEWMWQKAVSCGLALNEQQRVSPNPADILRNSMTIWYRLLGMRVRTLGEKLPNSHEMLNYTATQRNIFIPSYNPLNMREFLKKNN